MIGGSGQYNNTIRYNTIKHNDKYGVYCHGSAYSGVKNNSFYNNNFINNFDNACDDGSNIWDNGYPSGGNYWDDYRHTKDCYHGPNQDIPGSDGIGDIPYGIMKSHPGIPGSKKNRDNYPFINPNGWLLIANFTYRPPSPTDSDVIQFTDASVDMNGNIVNWTWDFGDGAISYLQNPTHQYTDAGTYNVFLTVKDEDGVIGSNTLTVTVVVDTAPPEVYAEFIPVEVEEDEGLFEISYSATDNCDPNPTVTAVIEACSQSISVENGQLVEIEIDDDDCEIEWDDDVLEIEAPEVFLKVTATDASGNAAEVTVQPIFPVSNSIPLIQWFINLLEKLMNRFPWLEQLLGF
jgi:parallel beta-helix repeat protein